LDYIGYNLDADALVI